MTPVHSLHSCAAKVGVHSTKKCQSMMQAQVNHVEEEIEGQKSSHFRGRAKVPLDFLHFSEHNPRDVDRDNVQRLMGVFREEGVKRLQNEHHVPAVVGKDDLLSAVQLSGVSLVDLLNSSQESPPRLTFPDGYRLRCLHGKHRIEAAKKSACLQGQDRWWTVTLYSEGLSKQAQRSLVEDYSSSRVFSDGLIFRKIVEYEGVNEFAKQHWWSWLTDCKKDILGRIFAHREYNAALRKLIRIPALLDDLNITVWHKIIATRSDEEFVHYFARILTTFDHICGREESLRSALDRDTVLHVQSRCPGVSLDDLRFLQRLTHERRIFRAVDDAARQEIWKRLRGIKHLIPTLGTLQKDFKYIKGPAEAVYKLLRPAKRDRRGRRTLRNLAESAFVRPRRDGKIVVQTTRDSIHEIAGDVNDQFEISFRQMYLYAMREAWDLVNDRPLKEPASKTPLARPPDPVVWHDFANFACTLGFDSPDIQRLKQTDPFQEKARQVFLDEQGWECKDALLQQLLMDAAKLYRAKDRRPPRQSSAQMVVDGPGEPVGARQGRCYENAYERDKQHLFFTTLSQPVQDRARSVTSLFVRKSVYDAFFPPLAIKASEPVASSPKEGTDGTGVGERYGDVDMPDVAASASSTRGQGSASPPTQGAGSTETSEESGRPARKDVRDDEPSTPSAENMSALNKQLVRRHSSSPSPPAQSSPPAPSSALQLVRASDVDSTWARKRPRTAYSPELIEDQTVGFSSPPAQSSPPALSSALQLVRASDVDSTWARKRPRTAYGPELIEDQSGGEDQTVPESPSTSSTSGESKWEDARADKSDPAEVVICIDPGESWEELEGSRCNSQQEVEDVLMKLRKAKEYFPSTKTRRGIMLSECYDRALRGDGCVYFTTSEEL